ncbi:MAG: trypco2 family protein [Gammaproteobacteria bacterium]
MPIPKVLLSLLCASVVSSCTLRPVKEPASVSVADVVQEVEATLNKVRAKNKNIGWKSVELTLETVAKKGASSSIDFWVVSAEASITQSVTQTVYYKLIPKPAFDTSKAPQSVSDQLSEAILKADSDLHQALAHSQTLTSQDSSVSIKFAVETSATGGAKVELVPVTVGAKGTVGKTAAHTIKITF